MAGDGGLFRRMTEHLDREEATIEELERRTDPMTSPTQRRHDELRDLLTEIRDAMKPQPFAPVDCSCIGVIGLHRSSCPNAPSKRREPVDVTEEGLPVDTAPDVDPDDTEAYLTGKRAPDQAEQLAARVLDLEADVERLTRERDEARRGPRQEPNRWCPKMLRERLCQQQTFAPDDITRDEIGGLIALLDLHRPVGPDGKHGERHTPTCGCEDDEQGQTDA